MFESFPYLFIIPKETDVKSHELILDHIHVYISLVFKQKLQEVSGPVYMLSVNSHCIAGKLYFIGGKRRVILSYIIFLMLTNRQNISKYFHNSLSNVSHLPTVDQGIER